MTKANDKVSRSYEFELRAENDEQHGDYISGRAIVYDTPTDIGGYFREIIDRGALDETDLTDVRLLINHNISMVPLARSRNNNANSQMQLSVDDQGMAIRANLDTENNDDSRKLYSAIRRGDISGMSFMFNVKTDKWEDLDTDYPTRHITGIGKVFEVSAVTFPAYESTSLQARDAEALESAKAALESAKRDELDAAKQALLARIQSLKGGNNA